MTNGPMFRGVALQEACLVIITITSLQAGQHQELSCAVGEEFLVSGLQEKQSLPG